jgi:hypothetical protein
MSSHFAPGGVQNGLVAAGFDDAGFRAVRHDQPRQSPKMFEGADMRADPAGRLLAPGSLGEGVT